MRDLLLALLALALPLARAAPSLCESTPLACDPLILIPGVMASRLRRSTRAPKAKLMENFMRLHDKVYDEVRQPNRTAPRVAGPAPTNVEDRAAVMCQDTVQTWSPSRAMRNNARIYD